MNRLPREELESPYLEAFKRSTDEAGKRQPYQRGCNSAPVQVASSGKSRSAVELLEFAVLRHVGQVRSKVRPQNFRREKF